jgi:hypothetical protein
VMIMVPLPAAALVVTVMTPVAGSIARASTFRVWLPVEERQPRLLEARWHE